MLNLGLGDPTGFGNLSLPSVLADAVVESLKTPSSSSNGYQASIGSLTARAAIASYNYYCCDDEPNGIGNGGGREEFVISPEDVMMCSGCSGAIDLVMTAMLEEGLIV
jgi:aspartate/methionine/tyrosine aminotransferase